MAKALIVGDGRKRVVRHRVRADLHTFRGDLAKIIPVHHSLSRCIQVMLVTECIESERPLLGWKFAADTIQGACRSDPLHIPPVNAVTLISKLYFPPEAAFTKSIQIDIELFCPRDSLSVHTTHHKIMVAAQAVFA